VRPVLGVSVGKLSSKDGDSKKDYSQVELHAGKAATKVQYMGVT